MVPYDIMDEGREYEAESPPEDLRKDAISLFKIVCRVNDKPVVPVLGRFDLEDKLSPVGEFFAHLVKKDIFRLDHNRIFEP